MNNQSQPAGEKETKMTEIKIDKSTLPKDGSRVRFKTDKGDVFEGYFTGGDNIFQVGYEDSAKEWFFSWYVSEWEYIDGEPAPSTPNQSEIIDEKDKEIERLKAVIWIAWDQSIINCEVENGASPKEFKFITKKEFAKIYNL